MGQTIISAIGVYISTSIDYLIILFILFAQLSQNKQKWHIYAGQYPVSYTHLTLPTKA